MVKKDIFYDEEALKRNIEYAKEVGLEDEFRKVIELEIKLTEDLTIELVEKVMHEHNQGVMVLAKEGFPGNEVARRAINKVLIQSIISCYVNIVNTLDIDKDQAADLMQQSIEHLKNNKL